MKRLKNEKGVITIVTLITVLFMVSFLISSYIITANKVKTQKEMLEQTREIYKPKTTMEEVYNSYFSNDNLIPIYTTEQLLAIGNNEQYNIDGKIYEFSNTENIVYVLKNNLEINQEELNLESNWVPIYRDENFLGKLDGNGHTLKIITLSGDEITYNGETETLKTSSAQVTLTNLTEGNLVDYKIYGNSIQEEGTPIEIKSVGDLITDETDINYGKYKIQIKVELSSEYEDYIDPTITEIYIDEPLRKVGDYADYIDFANQVIVRNVEVIDNTGTLTLEESYKGLEIPNVQSIELPEILTYEGTNIIAVDTEVEPSEMAISYKLKNS